jgi:hypothetical protein
MSRKVVVLAAALILCFASAAPAHHSNAAYDLEHQQTVEATVKQVNWTNPHISFVVETDAKDGKPTETWVFEVSSPGVLTRSGWNKRSLQVGDHALFQYAPLRDGRPGGRKVTLPSGQELTYSLQPEEQ